MKDRKMLTPAMTAEMFSVSIGTLANMRSEKKGPKYYKFGVKVLYRLDDLEQYFNQNPQQTVDSLKLEVKHDRARA